MSRSSASSLTSVVSAMENAVVNLRSRSQYLVDGGAQLFDAGNVRNLYVYVYTSRSSYYS